MATYTDFEHSSCGIALPCYRYIRRADRLPTLEDLLTESLPSPLARVKLFSPEGRMAWYIAAYDPTHRLGWGAVATDHGLDTGRISLLELIAFRSPHLALPVERDLDYQPRTIARLGAEWLVGRAP